MKNLINLLVVMNMVLLSSCGSLGPKHNKAEIQKVKKVAILSFAIYQDKPADNLGLGSLTKGVKLSGNAEESPEMRELAQAVYEDLGKSLQKQNEFQIIPLQTLVNSATYKAFYNDKMKGVRVGGYHGDKKELVYVEGVVDQYNFQGLPFAKKVELAKSVGADAFIEYNAHQQINQGWGLGNIMGTGDFAFTTRSNITMYSLHSEEPIWRSQNVDGEKSRNSSEIKEGSQMKKLSIIGKESAKTSISELVKGL